MKKLVLAFIAMIYVSYVPCSGQSVRSQGLILTGSLISVTPKRNRDSVKPLFLYELQLYVQLRNDSNKPLIIFRPTGNLVARRIEFLDDFDDGSETGDISVRPSPWIVPFEIEFKRYRSGLPDRRTGKYGPNLETYDPYFELAKRIDLPVLASDELVVIEPGKYLEFRESLVQEDGFKLEIKPGQSLTEIERNTPIAENPAFRIEYKVSLRNHHPDDGLLRKLQDSWRRIGHLVLDGNGDFSVRSDLIYTRVGN